MRSVTHRHIAEKTFSAYRPITVEAKLNLPGEYQNLLEKPAAIESGPDNPDLAAAADAVTQSLLGPQGALRTIDRRRWGNGSR